jgi:hypothetical protein
MPRRVKANDPAALTDAERRDIMLWFGWGSILDYPTGPLDYLRDALKPSHRADFLAMPRPKRKAILRFIIAEHGRRSDQVQNSR